MAIRTEADHTRMLELPIDKDFLQKGSLEGDPRNSDSLSKDHRHGHLQISQQRLGDQHRFGEDGRIPLGHRQVMNQPEPLDPEKWVDEHSDYLFRFAISRLRDPEAAEEVVQETFVAGLKAKEQYSGTGSPRAWLLGILRRKIADVYRKRSRSKVIAEADEEVMNQLFDSAGAWKSAPNAFGSRPSQDLERSEFWDSLNHCISTLPQRQADVFTLRELDEWKADSICEELDISSSNLWVLLHRARLRLAKCLQKTWNQEEGASA